MRSHKFNKARLFLGARVFWGIGLLWLVLVSSLVSGCDESVNPILGTEEAFTFYGFFNPRSDTQAVRVYSIDGILKPESRDNMDALVTSTNKQTGETQVWRDSVVVFDNGTVGHVFYALFRPEHNTEYTFEATRSDGKHAFVDIKTPADGQTDIVDIVSNRSNVKVTLHWSGVPKVLQTVATYTVRVPFPDRTDTTTIRVRIPSGQAERIGPELWNVTIIPSLDIGTIFTALSLRPGVNPILLDEIDVGAFVVSEDWESPIGVFDEELLVQPNAFSNVENGFGFIGGAYFDHFVFELSDKNKMDAVFDVE